MPIVLHKCPSCKGNPTSVFKNITRYNPDYPNYGVAEDNCMLKDVLYVDEITRDLMLCHSCGLYFISPTFSNEELSRLYGVAKMSDHYKKVKSGLSSSPAANLGSPEITWKKEAPHSQFVYDSLSRFRKPKANEVVVDIGGSSGYHCRQFITDKLSCFVQDIMKSPNLYPGVGYIPDLSSVENINFGICTHVLEHVVDLNLFLKNIAAKQGAGDLLYLEVPYELDSRLRKKNFGVPFHINFFSPESLNNLLLISGYKPLETKIRRMTCGGSPIITIYSILEKTNTVSPKKFVPGGNIEILRGGFYRVMNRFMPKLIQV